MMLNARQIHFKEDPITGKCPPIILLAMEDITEMVNVSKKFAGHVSEIEARFIERTGKMEIQIKRMEKEIIGLKKKS